MVDRKAAAPQATQQPASIKTISFGELLRQLRESYLERVGGLREGSAVAFAKLTQLGLIKCLESHEVTISQGFYSEIEKGESLPKDPKQFLAAAAACLELDSDDRERLALALGIAVLRRFEIDSAIDVLMRDPTVIELLRDKSMD